MVQYGVKRRRLGAKTFHRLAILLTAIAGCSSASETPPATERSSDGPPSNSLVPAGADAFRASVETIAEHNRAVALMGQFDYDAAYRALERLAQAYPEWQAVRVDWAIAALNRRQPGDAQRALSLLNGVLQQDPGNLRAQYCRGIVWLDGGETKKALDSYKQVADQDPTDAYALYYAGLCHFQLGDPERAIDYYRRAIAADPYLRSGYYGAFQASAQLGRREQSQQFMEQFRRLEGNPQARLAEIKYTRMGPKATLHAIDTPADGQVDTEPPAGALFAQRQSIEVDGEPVRWATEPAAGRQVSVARLSENGPTLVMFVGCGPNGQRPNVVLRQTMSTSWEWLEDHPLAAVAEVNAVLWGDYDNDGLTDVYLCRNGPNQLWRQVEPNAWADVSAATGTAGDGRTVDGQMFDADHDGDLDLLLVNSGPNELLNNNRDGSFRPLAAEQGLTGGPARSRAAVVLDIDQDRDLDYWIINDSPPHELYLNDRLWNYRRVVHPGEPPAADNTWSETADSDLVERYQVLLDGMVQAAVAVDLQADGQTELIGLTDSGLAIFAPNDAGVWRSRPLTIDGIADEDWLPWLSVADLDGDAASELLAMTRDGWAVVRLDQPQLRYRDNSGRLNAAALAILDSQNGPALLAIRQGQGVGWKPGPGRFKFLTLAFTGKEERAEQMRSNRSGIGVEAAARLGTDWIPIRTLRRDSGPGQDLQPIAVGLAGRPRLDFLRMTWPDGVFQTELNLSAGRNHRIAETQRQVASCPVVFGWNGREFQFVTDVLGVAGIGFNVGRGQYGEPRPWENLLLPEKLLQPKQGRYCVKIGEPMEEVCYLDAARLVVYDLPRGWDMTVDERFAVDGPSPTGQPLFYRTDRVQRPVAATNDRNQSVLSQIYHVDGRAAEPGRPDQRFIGRTEPHWIELEFAKPLLTDAPYLLFDGWIEYPYSQTMFAAWQAGANFAAPTVEAFDGEADVWRTVVARFGYMAGMPRQAVVPLDPDRLPAQTRRLRIRCNVEIYWDRLAVIQAEEPASVSRQALTLQRAEVAEVGFARRTTGPQRRPDYDYQRRTPLWDTRHPRGLYSRFGSALPLVSEVDDTVAVIGPGEEVHLEFRFPGQLSSPQYGSRRLVLELNGWCKDMDLYTRNGHRVAPLPRRKDARRLTDQQQRRRQRLHRANHTRYDVGY